MKPWRVSLLWAVVLIISLSWTAGGGDRRDAARALDEGNEQVAAGELEQALTAYWAGYDPHRPHATLVYNLGTVHHHLGKLPEAVLWYLRSPDSDDPWLQENLWLARRSLGSQQLPGGTFGTLATQADRLAQVGIASAWLCLFVFTFASRVPRGLPAAVGLLALAFYLTAFSLHRWGPRPAVLMTDCATAGAELPAGTEAWVRPAAGAWHIVGTVDAVCPDESVGLVTPR